MTSQHAGHLEVRCREQFLSQLRGPHLHTPENTFYKQENTVYTPENTREQLVATREDPLAHLHDPHLHTGGGGDGGGHTLGGVHTPLPSHSSSHTLSLTPTTVSHRTRWGLEEAEGECGTHILFCTPPAVSCAQLPQPLSSSDRLLGMSSSIGVGGMEGIGRGGGGGGGGLWSGVAGVGSGTGVSGEEGGGGGIGGGSCSVFMENHRAAPPKKM